MVEAAQREAASQAAAYVPAVMDELAGVPRMEGRVNPAALVGVAGSGVPLDDVLGISVIRAKQAVGSGATVHQARHDAGVWLRGTISTVLSDTGRAAERVGMASGRVSSYARMLVPPSCSRCVVLAGRVYRSRDAFERHPQCDCRHVPAPEADASDLTLNADEYFASLSRAEQDRIFTKAGAEAIRNGADLNQVVNARRGMSRAQSGRQARDAYGFYSTTSGTSRRGLYGSSQTTFDRRTGARRRAVNRPRLMPESIQEIARDQDDYLRLLRLYRFII